MARENGNAVNVRNGARARTLAPKEHGAYAQLALPLVASLAGGRPNLAALSFGAAGVLAFIAHEPLLVLVGQRGERARRDDGARARRRLGWLGVCTLALGALGLILAPTIALWMTLLPIALGVVVAGLIRARIEKTAAGEMLVAAALSSVGLLASVAAGAPLVFALAAWGGWCVAFASMTMSVRIIVANARRAIPTFRRVAIPVLLAPASVAIWALGLVPVFMVVAFLPTLILALALAIKPPSPRHLRRVGWTIVGATSFAAMMLIIGSQAGRMNMEEAAFRDRVHGSWSASCIRIGGALWTRSDTRS